MNNFGEPWTIALGFDHHELVTRDGQIILGSDGTSDVRAWQFAERIRACLNFCREFPTEHLLHSHMWHASEERFKEWRGNNPMTLADIPEYCGQIVCVRNEPSAKEAMNS